MSDEHFDSKKCDRSLLKGHHEEAKEKNAIILKFGDVFDAMGGKYDKRSTKADIRPEYQTNKYFDDIVEDATKFYEPYKEHIKLIAVGNHESSVMLRHEIDILGQLTRNLGCHYGKYSGFVKFRFSRNDK